MPVLIILILKVIKNPLITVQKLIEENEKIFIILVIRVILITNNKCVFQSKSDEILIGSNKYMIQCNSEEPFSAYIKENNTFINKYVVNGKLNNYDF
jgi:hypothetical protein